MNLWFDNAGPLHLGTGFRPLLDNLVYMEYANASVPVRRENYPLRSRLTSNQHQYQYHYQGGVFAVGAVVGSMVDC